MIWAFSIARRKIFYFFHRLFTEGSVESDYWYTVPFNREILTAVCEPARNDR